MRHGIRAALAGAAVLILATATTPTSAAGTYGYTITPLTSLTQSWPTIDFLGPYFYFLLHNEAAVQDSMRLSIQNLTEPAWFPQVCLRSTCFPDSAVIPFGPGATDTVGVNIVPFFDGSCQADFRVVSTGDPGIVRVFHITLYAGTAAVDVRPVPQAVATLQLAPSFPNPVRSDARIGFVLPAAAHVTLRLYDVMGRQVATLVDGSMAAGPHTAEWNGTLAGGRSAPAGTYFYRLETAQGALSRRLVLIR